MQFQFNSIYTEKIIPRVNQKMATANTERGLFYIIFPTRKGIKFNMTAFQKWGIASKLISSHMV